MGSTSDNATMMIKDFQFKCSELEKCLTYFTIVGVVTFPSSAVIPLGHVTLATPGGTLLNTSGTTLCSSIVTANFFSTWSDAKKGKTSE